MNKKTSRFHKITALLQQEGRISVKELSQRMGVSEMTVRRDLNDLEKNGLVHRGHGSAAIAEKATSASFEDIETRYSLFSALADKREEKQRIGQYAAGMIEAGDVIILDNGSTTDMLADYIPADKQLTIACYNLNIITKLPKRDNIKLIFAGGFYHPSDQMFESAEGIQFLKKIRANKLFITASGIHGELGLTCAHDFEVGVKQTVLQSALRKILVADSSKFGTIKTVFFAHLSQIDAIVTDTGLTQEWQEFLEKQGIEFHMV